MHREFTCRECGKVVVTEPKDRRRAFCCDDCRKHWFNRSRKVSAKNQGKASSAKRILAVLVAAGSIGGTISGVQAANNITEIRTPPQMIGYQQKWDTDVKNGKLGTSIYGWQNQGNSLQLNYLNFEKYTTQKGENGLAIRLGANVDGINKGGNLYFVDTNTKNTALSTVIDDKGNIKLTVTDSDNEKVESTVNISNYVQSEVNKKSDYHLIANTDKNSEGVYKVDDAGNIDLIVADDTNKTKNTIRISNVASKDSVAEAMEEAKKHSSVSTTDKNLSIDSTGTNNAGGIDYKVSLKNDLKLGSVTTGDTKMNTDGVKVGENVSLTKDGLTAGDTKVTNAGLSIGDKTYVSKDGLNANNQTITNVADGKVEKGSTDAVNGGQLYETNQAIANNATNISSLSHSISNLDNRVNKVGAGAAALAALHPLDFDPDAKWDFAAGYGNYRGANAAAVGAYYRPNEDTMFSVGGTFGNGENMVNAGVSFKLGSGSSHVSTSRVAMAKEIKELRGELEAMKSAMLDANAGKKIDTSKLQLFPDVPQNHWAYEYVAQLAGNGMIEGYPDGNFAGDRPMTRYEFAAILYRAMTKGAVLSDKILSEFSHELEYFTVDTIAKDKAGNPTIQRVRTVKENKNK